MTPGKLKEILIANGWRTAPEHKDTGVGWYAYRNLEGAMDCTSNEKSPGICIVPWEIKREGDTPWRSVEFAVAGEVGGDSCLSMKVYSVSMDGAIAAIPRASAILLTAWNAAAALEMPEAGRGDLVKTPAGILQHDS